MTSGDVALGPAPPSSDAVRDATHTLLPNATVDARAAVDIRSAALAVIAVLASVFALRWASPVIIPVMVGLTVSYALNPAVDALQRWHLPRALGAALVIGLVFGGAGWTLYRVSSEAGTLIESLPEAAKKVNRTGIVGERIR